METLVPTTQTPVTPKSLYFAMHQAWLALIPDDPPTRARILTMLAQSAFETGWWHYCWNWNLGNVKHVAGDGRDYYQIRCNEIVGGKVRWYDPPDPATSFVSYADPETGVRDYLAELRHRFAAAWPAVLAGDPAAFCHELKAARYYTDDETHYTTNVVRCYGMLDRLIPIDGAIGTQAATEEGIEADVAADTIPPPPPPEDA